MNSNNADSVISIVDVHGMNPYKMRTINSSGFLQELIPLERKSTNRQKLPKAYIPNGAVFMVKTSILLEQRSFFGKHSLPYEMREEASVNIDTPLDLELTKVILQKGIHNEV
jgi:CMP-N-acetylneuraminic acid synthetase